MTRPLQIEPATAPTLKTPKDTPSATELSSTSRA